MIRYFSGALVGAFAESLETLRDFLGAERPLPVRIGLQTTRGAGYSAALVVSTRGRPSEAKKAKVLEREEREDSASIASWRVFVGRGCPETVSSRGSLWPLMIRRA